MHRAEDFESAFVALSFCLEISPPQKLSDRFRVRRAPRAPPTCPPGVLDGREDEEQVREAIHVADHGWSNRLLETDLNDLPLGPSHDCASHMEQGRALCAARQHKRRERLQLRVLSIEHLLQPSHLIVSHPQRLQLQAGAGWTAEIGTDVKEIILNSEEDASDLLLHMQARQTDERVRLIHRAESRYTDVEFWKTRSVAQNRATIIAGSGVNPIELTMEVRWGESRWSSRADASVSLP